MNSIVDHPVESSAIDGLRRGVSWPKASALVLGGLLLLLALFWHTAVSIVAIWARSETFTHGFLIVPIVVYLIWLKRKALTAVAPQPSYMGLALLAGAGIVWLVSNVAGVLVFEQFGFVAMIPAFVLTVLGWRVARVILFPLSFLFLAVPFGEIFIPPMMTFTADFTVGALQLTGIPVYREGTFFSIPSGNWSVVEACSGLRYLIASFTLGTLYAYLTYRSAFRRTVFVVLSILVPIIANGMRAYLIVMIGHLSNMQLAVGIDHLIYGWIFFGIVIILLFWIGAFWREDLNDTQAQAQTVSASGFGATLPQLGAAALLSLGLLAVWPAYAKFVEGRSNEGAVTLIAPGATAQWEAVTTPQAPWTPHYQGDRAHLLQAYAQGDQQVQLYIAFYRNQTQDRELINSQNFLVASDNHALENVGESDQTIQINGRRLTMVETRLRAPDSRLLVWQWYWLDGHNTVNPYIAKALEARQKLSGKGDDGAAIIISTPYSDDIKAARARLQVFTDDMYRSIERSLIYARESGAKR